MSPQLYMFFFFVCKYVNSIGTIESKSLSNWDTHPSKDVVTLHPSKDVFILPKIRPWVGNLFSLLTPKKGGISLSSRICSNYYGQFEGQGRSVFSLNIWYINYPKLLGFIIVFPIQVLSFPVSTIFGQTPNTSKYQIVGYIPH